MGTLIRELTQDGITVQIIELTNKTILVVKFNEDGTTDDRFFLTFEAAMLYAEGCFNEV